MCKLVHTQHTQPVSMEIWHPLINLMITKHRVNLPTISEWLIDKNIVTYRGHELVAYHHMGRTQLPKTNSEWQWATKYVLTENPTFASTLDDWKLRIVICGLEVWFVAGLLGKNVSNRSADVCMYFLLDNQDFYCDVTGSFSGGFPFQWHSQFTWGYPGWFRMSAVVFNLNTTKWKWTIYIYIKSKVQQCSGIE